MNTKKGNRFEMVLALLLKIQYPKCELINHKTHGIDLTFKLQSKIIKIEVKSCNLKNPIKSSGKYRDGLFVIHPKDLIRNDIFAFFINKTHFLYFITSETLKRNLELINKRITGKLFHVSIKQMRIIPNLKFSDIVDKYCFNIESCYKTCNNCQFQATKQEIDDLFNELKEGK